jgi:hypothetical protein
MCGGIGGCTVGRTRSSWITDAAERIPWYFPTDEEYRACLEEAGFHALCCGDSRDPLRFKQACEHGSEPLPIAGPPTTHDSDSRPFVRNSQEARVSGLFQFGVPNPAYAFQKGQVSGFLGLV